MSRRGGMTILEMAAALVVATAAIAAVAQLVSLASRQRKARHERLTALTEVANQAERMALLDWNELAPGKLTTWQASPELLAAVPKVACSVTVKEDSGQPAGREIQLRITWQNSVGQTVDPVLLTLWRFRPEDQP